MSEVTPLHPPDDVDDEELRAADGRVPGRRGRATRQRLLECTRDMLTTTSYRDVKVIDIAREAGTSPATFYQYFADVEAAILVLAEEMAQQGHHLTEIITDGSWVGSQAFETSLTLVDAFLAFWEDHRPVLRVMDFATDEGDGRFQKIRVRLLNDITNALADVTRASQLGGGLPPGSTRWRWPEHSSRCSPTPRRTSTGSSSGASAPPSCARRWRARCRGASPGSPRPTDGVIALGLLPPYRLDVASDPAWMAAFAQHADEVGFESLLAVEHVAVPVGYESRYPYSDTGRMPLPEGCELPDPLDLLAWLAARTQRLRLAPGSSCCRSTTRCSSPSAARRSIGCPVAACSSASAWGGCAKRWRPSASIPTSGAPAPTRGSRRCG